MAYNQDAADAKGILRCTYAAVASGLHPPTLEESKGVTLDDCIGAALGARTLSEASTTDATSSNAATPEPDSDETDWEQQRQYDLVDVIGEGVYGTVHLAIDCETGEQVALKQLKLDDDCADGVPAHVIREVSLLRDFVHPNIVQLKHSQNIGFSEYQLIFEYVPDDLYQILRGHRRAGNWLPMAKVLGYSQDLLNGVYACHARLIIHRDLKPQNLLIHPVHGLKICDFGLARTLSTPSRPYTPEVVTLWYRCMELLLGRHEYGAEVDVWSTGCIVAEMATGHALFPGDCEIGTAFKIMQLVGSPTEATWPGFQQQLPHWSKIFPAWPSTGLKAIRDARPELGEVGIDLLQGLLALNPASRPRARRARSHALFSQPCPA